MALFKKLNEEIQKSEVKQEVINLSEKDRKELENAIIFGDVLESLDVDTIEKEYKSLDEDSGIDSEKRRLKRQNMQKIRKNPKDVSSFDVDASAPDAPVVPEKIQKDQAQ